MLPHDLVLAALLATAAPQPSQIEDCVYDRALEYFINGQPETDANTERVRQIILHVCIGHELPLLPYEDIAVQRSIDRAFDEAIKIITDRGMRQ